MEVIAIFEETLDVFYLHHAVGTRPGQETNPNEGTFGQRRSRQISGDHGSQVSGDLVLDRFNLHRLSHRQGANHDGEDFSGVFFDGHPSSSSSMTLRPELPSSMALALADAASGST